MPHTVNDLPPPSRNLVYVAVPKYLHFAHDYILQHVLSLGEAPITPYSGPFWLLDTVDRTAIREANATYIDTADEIWAYGTKTEHLSDAVGLNGIAVTDGVLDEVVHAIDMDTPVTLFTIHPDSQSITKHERLTDTDDIEYHPL